MKRHKWGMSDTVTLGEMTVSLQFGPDRYGGYSVSAHTGDIIGKVTMDHDGKLRRMAVFGPFRRRGVMTALWDFAKRCGVPIYYDPFLNPLTEDGQAFMESREND